MYGLPAQIALLLDEVVFFEDHQNNGVLLKIRQDRVVVVFISHTWLGYCHPDPKLEQLHALQRILGRIINGRHDIPCTWLDRMLLGNRRIEAKACKEQFTGAALWMDYWCIPQAVDDPMISQLQQIAIRSIPAYVARANYFMVLAPPCTHTDQGQVWGHQEWLMRAWCRLEMMCHVFSKVDGQIIVAESESRVYLAVNHQWLHNAPGQGELTCCNLGHKIRREGRECSIPCDREAIGRLMLQMYQDKLNLHLESNDLESFRLFLSLKAQLLAGLPQAPLPAATVDLRDFLHKYKYKTALDEEGKAGSGWSPLRFAAYEGNVIAAQQLLQAKADVECPIKQPRADVRHLREFSILAGSCQVNGNPSILLLLLDSRANLHSRANPDKSTPAEHCVANPEGFRLLVQRGYDVNQVRNIFGHSLVCNACWTAPQTVPFLVKQGIKPRRSIFGICHCGAAVLGGNDSALEGLLKITSEVEYSKLGGTARGLGRMIVATAAAANLVSRDPFYAFLAEWPKSTPLHLAAAEGKVRAVSLLLAHGFQLDSRNRRGRTPIHMACLFGHRPVLQLFAEHAGFQQAAAVRCTHGGQTAAELALAAGFWELLALLPEGGGAAQRCCRRRATGPPSSAELPRDDAATCPSIDSDRCTYSL